jgi:Ca2+-binding RTX toxin-like protein
VIFGNLGQDDIIGGNSNLFSLANPTQRPDGADLIFGGAGIDIARSDAGDLSHGRDSDMILGDNGNIYRIVGTPGFNYDDGYGEQIVVRAAKLLDYTPGGKDYDDAGQALDIGAVDEIHGESGDDFIYAQVGNDVVFGEGQDDAIVGGYGNDWISGGTGDDAVLGDDGRIFASRNSSLGEPLNGIAPIPVGQLNTIIKNSNGDYFAITNVAGALKYTVDLTPYSVDPSKAAPTTLMPRALYANDIIYGGLGNDALHGGAGEDAISGAEAPTLSYVNNYKPDGTIEVALIRSDYAHPFNPGNVLGYNPTTTKFALYDANDPLRKVLLTPTGPKAGELSKTGSGFEWALNFDYTEGPLDTYWIKATTYTGVPTDGDDVIFGDLGHDWMVGGTGRDTVWAGWGDDLVNIDDVLTTSGGLNDKPEPNPSWEDFTYGGAGRDVMIGNTGGDRMVDWNGEQNTFVLPYNPFGLPTVSRGLAPDLEVFMIALSKSQGADPTLAAQYNSNSLARNGEPFGELGMVRQGDAAMGDQNGGPRDPQSPYSKAKIDVRGSAGVQPLWETAGEAEATGGEDGSAASINDAMLTSAVEEAKLRWIETLGAGNSRLAALASVSVQVGNLPGDRIGVTLGYDIYIDSDAAGRGWQTMDLASVVMHELGHVLGFDHDDAGAIPVMNGILDAGAHYQLEPAGNAAASLDLAVFTGADIAQQAIDPQLRGVSIVTPSAKSALTDGLGFSANGIVVCANSLLDHAAGALDLTSPFAASDLNWFIYSPSKIPQAKINVPDDDIYGGLGNNFLHGRADLVSGAEALVGSYIGYSEPNNPAPVGVERSDYTRLFNPGNTLAFGGRYAGVFGAYQEFAPLVRIVLPGNHLYFSKFDAGGGPAAGKNGAGASAYSDGNDRLSDDLGNDWIVGGPGKYHAFGGWGDDLINMDDEHTTAGGGFNNQPDTATSYEDVAYGGTGRDVLIANTGRDRLIDWVGEFLLPGTNSRPSAQPPSVGS